MITICRKFYENLQFVIGKNTIFIEIKKKNAKAIGNLRFLLIKYS
jgi:hypothetical protein